MKPISLDFSRRTELAVEAQAIAAVSAVALPMQVPLLIVGAFARDLHVRYRFGKDPQRVTEDIDLAVAVPSWSAFNTLREGLIASGQFSGQPAVLHALRHASGLAVDLVPFSGVESAERRIAWPPRGEFVMDVFGFQEAQAAAHSIQLPGNVPAKLISLPALAILKLVTWRDRHFSAPRKDAHDLMLIIGEYLALGNEDRLWSEFADWAAAEDFDYEAAGARMLGRDMLASLDRQGVERIGTILAAEADEESPGTLANAMRPTNPDGARKLLAVLYQGLLGT